jgi:anaphase-promoting complex subunit 4
MTLQNLASHVKHVFKNRFKPAKIEVNGRKNRRVCIVLGEDSRHLRVYDVDHAEGEGEDRNWERVHRPQDEDLEMTDE